MKKLIFLLIMLCFFTTSGQQKHFKINWEGEKTLSTSSSKIIIPAFNNENFNFSYNEGLKFVSVWEIPAKRQVRHVGGAKVMGDAGNEIRAARIHDAHDLKWHAMWFQQGPDTGISHHVARGLQQCG